MLPCRPTRPQDFLFVDPSQHGYYVFGSPDFRVRPLRVANVFHRSFLGRQEDFVLGVLSVILIALLTEIFQVVLMRTSRDRVTRSGFDTAFVIDELTHFRNIFSHVRHRSRSRVSRGAMWSSVTILSIGGVLIAAEVLAVYLTQPFKVYAPTDQYNLRGIQPVETSEIAAIEVDKLTDRKRCVSPMMPGSNQSREFSISACVNRSADTALQDVKSTATYVEIASWFHKAGSDHHIMYGNERTSESGTHRISTRATIMQSDLGITNGIIFDVNKSTIEPSARYLHSRAVQAAINKSCEIFGDNCDQRFERCKVARTEKSRSGEIILWEVKKETGVEEPVIETVNGIVTRFNVTLRAPSLSLKASFRIFATSAAVEEVLNGHGRYVSMPRGDERSTMEQLVSEEGRIAGIVLLGLVVLSMVGLLILLRVIFKPISMARIAKDAFDEDDEVFGDDEDFLGPGPDLSQQTVWTSTRDIVEPDLEDYASTDKFDVPLGAPPKRGFWHPYDRGPMYS